jgi:nitroimidazol reductase NimA-like FMN-containing flavoprotein (pyridoxamine 5'-phosphate oxidase superfamily)
MLHNFTKLNANYKTASYDTEFIHGIVNECPILHVSFNAPPKDGPQFPTILPMLGTIATYADDEQAHVYVHGSNVARLFKLTTGGEMPICVAATILDGYVLSLAPFHNSCNYRCAVLFGYGSVVEDPKEVLWAMRLITNESVPHRWENSRHPPSKSEITATAVLKIRIETASAKTRAGGPGDEKSDLQNAELSGKTWTGVVPTYQMMGQPIEDANNKVKVLPEYLADWVADANSMAEQRAVDSVEG